MPDLSLRTVLGFDFGMKRIGVAVGQTITLTANPLMVLNAMDGVPDWEQISQLIQQWKPDALIVGIPTRTDGSPLYVTQPAKDFADELKQRYQLPVYTVDEHLSTQAAKQQLFEQGGFRKLQSTAVDSLAAKFIIESWFSSLK